jgi:hypothetical protein
LNEALGIRGEGMTAQAAPKATPPASAFLSPAGIAPPMGGPPSDFSDFAGPSSGSGGHLPADLFDNVPRASAQELVNREQTKFFVAAAGVDQKKSRNKVGLATGAAIAVSVGLFFVLWASGIIQINIPGLGNPFAPIGKPDVAPQSNGEVSPEDVKLIKQILSEREYNELSKTKNGLRDYAMRHRIKRSDGRIEYVRDPSVGGGGLQGPRGDDPGAKIEIGGNGIGLNDVPDSKPIATALPGEAAPQIEKPDYGNFDDKVVARKINEVGKKAVSDCYRRELMGNQNLAGKLEVLMTLQPSGEVSRATVETPTFKGTQLGECIAKRLRDLRFPAFSGEPHQFVVPFVLDSGHKM